MLQKIILISLLLIVGIALFTPFFFIKLAPSSLWQYLGWILVFSGLLLTNEAARRTKTGGIITFVIVPIILTIYYIILEIAGTYGVKWATENWTFKYMNGWFHYDKLYASTLGCIGFIMIKYEWGFGKSHWFHCFPFVIVVINILIAVVSDFESAIMGAKSLATTGSRWWYSSEHVYKYGGWWNWVNGIAGLINCICMTDWWGIFHTKDRADMLWPDMTYVFITAYDIWNFEYTYNCLPTHSWYCGMALLLAPTVANFLWNKGGWIQNRAFTLSLWCMFAQTFPEFQDGSRFTTFSSVYPQGYTYQMMQAGINPNKIGPANPTMQGIIASLALISNIIAIIDIIYRAKNNNKNPYTNPIFCDQNDFKEAINRADNAYLLEKEINDINDETELDDVNTPLLKNYK